MANTNLLDAWNDFSKIKHILNNKAESIVILLGASWCHKCDPVKKSITRMTQHDTPTVNWLWLDLEDHCEFLGNFSPETIPLVWVYQGEHLIRHGVIEENKDSEQDFLEFILSIPVVSTTASEANIRSFLLADHLTT
jgi:thiol-disulfide isomerase/thioredoxin